ncbi:phage tail protein [Sneathiella aquimaris]|uniref:phage tail protein n=1 Tax=Sneathiella aquimaris TaxID=2599305 RepID=UPI00146E779D|nr:phage tail protein [Sneathiella aquimaris]
MATLALSVAGAGLGSVTGVGAGAGWQLGSALGQIFFPDQKKQGPSLTDLKFSGASYGASIPTVFGTMRLGGNLIWAGPLESRSSAQEYGGKGGLGGETKSSSGYKYYASFAIGLAQGPVGEVLKIWADGTVIFDMTAAGSIRAPGVSFRFYKGSEDQIPDGIIVSEEGIANTPAYRGVAYLVFDSLPLEAYGNRIPNIEVLMSMEGVHHFPLEEGAVVSIDASSLSYDPIRETVYTYEVTGGVDRFRKIEGQSLVVQASAEIGTEFPRLATSTTGLSRDRNGNFWIGSGFALLPGRRLSVFSGQGFTEVGTTELPGHIGAVSWSTDVLAPSNGSLFQVAGSQQSGQVVLFDQHLDVIDFHTVESPVCTGGVTDQFETAWVAMSGNISAFPFEDLQICSMRLNTAPSETGTVYNGDFQVHTIPSAALTPAGGGGSETNNVTRLVAILEKRRELVFQNDERLFKWSMDTKNVTVVRDSNSLGLLSLNNTTNEDELVYLHGGQWLVYLDAETLEETERVDLLAFDGVADFSNYIYDAQTDSVLLFATSAPVRRLFLRRRYGKDAVLSEMVQNLGKMAGLLPEDIDISKLSGSIPGYILNRNMTVQNALEPLMVAGDFDLCESGYQLQFVPRDTGPQHNLFLEECLSPVSDERLQESELPGTISINYMAADNGYQLGAHQAKRSFAPYSTMFGRNAVNHDLPMALTAPLAKATCRRILYSAWTERQQFSVALPTRYLALDPTDLLSISTPKGEMKGRVVQADFGADLSHQVKGVAVGGAPSGKSTLADTGSGYQPMSISRPSSAELFVLDIPLLRDEDATGGSGSRYYFAADGNTTRWQGAALFRSDESGTAFYQRGSVQNEPAWGIATSVLEPTQNPWQTDYKNSVVINMLNGEDRLEEVTRDLLLSGANAMLLGQEIIQFQSVALQPDGRYLLSNLLRGRRGTEGAMQAHRVGDVGILLQPEILGRDIAPLSMLETTLQFKAVGAGQLTEDVRPSFKKLTGNDLKPYAPVHFSAVRSVSGITFQWQRRTRIGGGALSGNVPLSEAYEAYEIEVSSAGKTVSRFIRDATTFDYSLAAFNDDFNQVLSEIPQIDVTIFQLSEAVGRGFPAKETF